MRTRRRLADAERRLRAKEVELDLLRRAAEAADARIEAVIAEIEPPGRVWFDDEDLEPGSDEWRAVHGSALERLELTATAAVAERDATRSALSQLRSTLGLHREPLPTLPERSRFAVAVVLDAEPSVTESGSWERVMLLVDWLARFPQLHRYAVTGTVETHRGSRGDSIRVYRRSRLGPDESVPGDDTRRADPLFGGIPTIFNRFVPRGEAIIMNPGDVHVEPSPGHFDATWRGPADG